MSYTFKFPSPVITRAGEYDMVMMAGCEPWHVTDQPIVPFKGRAVLIPEGREIAGIRFETGERIMLPGRYYLEPAGPMIPPPGSGTLSVMPTRTGGPSMCCWEEITRSADYDGDGEWEIAIFRPPSGLWAVQGATRAYFGSAGDIPVTR